MDDLELKCKFTAHKVVDDGVDGTVEVTHPVRDQGEVSYFCCSIL